jgi:hypothetical protein
MVRYFASDDPFKNALVGACLAFAAIGGAGLFLGAERPPGDFYWIAFYYFAVQDAGLAIAIAFALAIILARPADRMARAPADATWRTAALIATLLFVGCMAGRFAILGDYNLSRDEQLADYDAAIFATGALYAPAPQEWNDLRAALNDLYLLPSSEGSVWVSAYLPVNAALRAIGVATLGSEIINPLFVAIGALALWRIVGQIWPQERELVLPALLLYALSAQILVHGMSSYAMSGHLALNLVWLWLYLKRRLWSDLGALGAGFLATGLHQPLFHPLFAAPILALLIADKQRRRACLFLLGYAAIAVFWLSWPGLVLSAAGATPGPEASYAERIIMLISAFNPADIGLLLLNLVRWATWQHALFAPLLVLGASTAWRAGGILRALAVCVAVYPLVVFFLMAFQVQGWGYRHLHGVLGPAILLCVAGLRTVAPGIRQPALVAASLASAAVIIPIQLAMVRAHYGAYADIDQRIAASGADLAIIDLTADFFANDMVYNDPDLGNRPLRLAAQGLDAASLDRLCKSSPDVVLVGRDDFGRARALFVEAKLRPPTKTTKIFEIARARGCRTFSLAGS